MAATKEQEQYGKYTQHQQQDMRIASVTFISTFSISVTPTGCLIPCVYL